MSVSVGFYTIAGYDLTNYKKDEYENFVYSKRYDELTDFQTKGNIQLFTDPMDGDHLFLGYVLSAIEDDEMYGENITSIDVDEVMNKAEEVDKVLNELIEFGMINDNCHAAFKILSFTECR